VQKMCRNETVKGLRSRTVKEKRGVRRMGRARKNGE